MKCKECNKDVGDRHNFCGHCGWPVSGKRYPRKKISEMHCFNCNTTRRLLGPKGAKWRPKCCHNCGAVLGRFVSINS